MKFSSVLPASFLIYSTALGWNMALYNTDSCNNGDMSYYYIEGSNDADSGCISFPHRIPDGVSCRFYTNGGKDHTSCDRGTFVHPTAYTLSDGHCTVWHGTACDGGVSGVGDAVCHSVFRPESNWGSMKCKNA
ncbi:uncharacterized protein BDW47DRAFT_102371 [Aspergillus candidus]|uniref:Secreted LysM effector LysM C-terminal domain-containing protein n=1 Tax=Aspergillus candidus TaxID=41067 RepID=A0A2I2FGM2_ASPCN|nr:hypothetical protein BDW47DRAFT_102371 [Aspergillus candidus]PLB39764.1 hypothetical protein BDW47DRAFT_102371 [Aspergillus candidus]